MDVAYVLDLFLPQPRNGSEICKFIPLVNHYGESSPFHEEELGNSLVFFSVPLLHLSRRLLHHSLAVTIVTTPNNLPSIRSNLHDVVDQITLISLPFPQNVPNVPPGIENTNNLPSMSCFVPFVKSTKLMQNSFEESLRTLHPPVSCIISDAFLGWTVESANKFSVPRLFFFGMSTFACTMYEILGRFKPHRETKSLEDTFEVPHFPQFKLTLNDFEPPFNAIEPEGEYAEFMGENIMAMRMSYGVIANSFYELEPSYVDFWNKEIGPKCFSIGPLLPVVGPEAEAQEEETRSYMKWLDQKLNQGEPVLYVAFGTQAEVSDEQFMEISKGLEQSEVNFLWVVRPKGTTKEFLEEFENRVQNRGIIVKEWVDQLDVLHHEAVTGFLSHCGWNSVIESIYAGVPILGMPFMAEQHINARFVAEEVKVGPRVMSVTGSVRGFVSAEEIERKVRELMFKGEEARRKAGELGRAAREAVREGGSSSRALAQLVDEVMCFSDTKGESMVKQELQGLDFVNKVKLASHVNC